jgi:hypothetical protein
VRGADLQRVFTSYVYSVAHDTADSLTSELDRSGRTGFGAGVWRVLWSWRGARRTASRGREISQTRERAGKIVGD